MTEYERLVRFLQDRYGQWLKSSQETVGDYYLGEAAEDDLGTIRTELAVVERCWTFLSTAEPAWAPDVAACVLAADVLRILARQFAEHPEFDLAWATGDGLML